LRSFANHPKVFLLIVAKIDVSELRIGVRADQLEQSFEGHRSCSQFGMSAAGVIDRPSSITIDRAAPSPEISTVGTFARVADMVASGE
jgi:hypothetical protein